MKGCPDVYSRRKKVGILFSAGRSGQKLIASGCRCRSDSLLVSYWHKKTLSDICSKALRAARSSWVCLAPPLEPRLLILTVRVKHITSEPCRKPLPGPPRRSSGPKRNFGWIWRDEAVPSPGGSSIRFDVELSHSWRSGSGRVAKWMTGDRCVVLSEHSSCFPS